MIPAELERATRLRLDPADASALAPALGRLPGGDDEHAAVTLELNGRVEVRARGDGPPTELVLARSSSDGPPLRLSTNRAYLARALELGLRELALAGPDRPVVARDETRTYAWQPLSSDSAIGPAADAARIESTALTTRPEPPRRSMAEKTIGNGSPGPPGEVGEATPTGGLAALIREAEGLHATLADARGRSARLVAGLRRHRKHSGLVARTLRSLRELKLAGVAE